MKNLRFTIYDLRALVATLAVSLFMGVTAFGQSTVNFYLTQFTGNTNDTTLNIQAANNPIIYNGQFYWWPQYGSNILTTNGFATISLVPGKYTVSIATVSTAWNITVTNSATPLNAAYLTKGVVIYNGINSLSGSSVTTDGHGNYVVGGGNTNALSPAQNTLLTNAVQANLSGVITNSGPTNATSFTVAGTNQINALAAAQVTGANLTGTLTNNTTGNAATATIASNLTILASAPAINQYASNLLFWLNPRAIITTNNLFAVSSWADSSGNGNSMYTDPTAANPIYNANLFNGAPGFMMQANWNRASGAVPNVFYAQTNLMWNTSWASNYCIFDVFQDTLELGPYTVPATAEAPYLFTAGNNDQTFALPIGFDSAGYSQCMSVQVSGTDPSTSGEVGLQHNFAPNVLCIRVINGVLDIWLNGVRVINVGALIQNTTTGNNFTIGNANYEGTLLHSGGDAFCGNQSDFLIFTNLAMPNAGVTSISTYLAKANNIGGGTAINLWGDSITIGAYSTSAYSNFLALAQYYNPHTFVSNFGISGADSGQVLGYMTNNAGAQPPNTGKVIDIFSEVVNDVINGVSAATFEKNLTNALDYSHSLGHKFDICTAMSFAGETGNTLTRAAANAFIYSLTNNPTPYAPDAIIPFDQDPIMGTNGASVQAGTVYFANSIHPNAAGYYQLYTAEMAPVLQAQLSSAGGNWNGNFSGNGSGLTGYQAVNLTTNGANPAPAQGQVLAVQGNGGIAFTNPASGGSGISALTGDVTASGSGSVAATVVQVGGYSAANVASGATAANAATTADTGSTIVMRNSIGNFSAGTISATFSGSGASLTALNASQVTSGTLPAAQLPAFTGDITTTAGSAATTLKATGTAGTYAQTTFDSNGRETSGSTTLPAADLTGSGTLPIGTIPIDGTTIINNSGVLSAVGAGGGVTSVVANNGLSGSILASVLTIGITGLNGSAITSGTVSGAYLPVMSTGSPGIGQPDGVTISNTAPGTYSVIAVPANLVVGQLINSLTNYCMGDAFFSNLGIPSTAAYIAVKGTAGTATPSDYQVFGKIDPGIYREADLSIHASAYYATTNIIAMLFTNGIYSGISVTNYGPATGFSMNQNSNLFNIVVSPQTWGFWQITNTSGNTLTGCYGHLTLYGTPE